MTGNLADFLVAPDSSQRDWRLILLRESIDQAVFLDKLVSAYTSVTGLLCVSLLKFQFKGDCLTLTGPSCSGGLKSG